MANENDTQTRPRKEMAMPAMITNVVVLLVLLGVSAYIIYRVIGGGSIVLFTYHPTFMVLGVRIELIMGDRTLFYNIL